MLGRLRWIAQKNELKRVWATLKQRKTRSMWWMIVARSLSQACMRVHYLYVPLICFCCFSRNKDAAQHTQQRNNSLAYRALKIFRSFARLIVRWFVGSLVQRTFVEVCLINVCFLAARSSPYNFSCVLGASVCVWPPLTTGCCWFEAAVCQFSSSLLAYLCQSIYQHTNQFVSRKRNEGKRFLARAILSLTIRLTDWIASTHMTEYKACNKYHASTTTTTTSATTKNEYPKSYVKGENNNDDDNENDQSNDDDDSGGGSSSSSSSRGDVDDQQQINQCANGERCSRKKYVMQTQITCVSECVCARVRECEMQKGLNIAVSKK